MSQDPTIKQQKAAKIHAEAVLEGKDKTKGQVLEEAGYAPSMQKKPGHVYRSEGFKKALSEFLPLQDVIRRHKELMDQDVDLRVAGNMVKEAYDVHKVKDEGGGGLPFAKLVQLINVQEQNINKE